MKTREREKRKMIGKEKKERVRDEKWSKLRSFW